MRKLVLSLLLALSWAALAQPTVVVSMHPHYDLVRQIAGGRAEVTRLLPLGASPHTFDPTPQDVVRISEASLIVLNGGLDTWLLDLVAASGTDAPVLELVTELEFERIGGDTNFNPHIWLDPAIMADAVPVFVSALSEVDPPGAATYRANGQALVEALRALDRELSATLAPAEGAAFVPFHNAWPYFARRYGLDQVAVIEPAPGREPSPSYLAEALTVIRDSGAKAIFSEVQLSQRPAEIVAAEAGLPLYLLDPEGGGTSDAETYGAFMRKNARTIARALGTTGADQ